MLRKVSECKFSRVGGGRRAPASVRVGAWACGRVGVVDSGTLLAPFLRLGRGRCRGVDWCHWQCVSAPLFLPLRIVTMRIARAQVHFFVLAL